MLSISTNETGSHRTIYACGTKAAGLIHDRKDNGEPTYTEGVFVEMVPDGHAAEVARAGAKGLHFSSTYEFLDWLIDEAPAAAEVQQAARGDHDRARMTAMEAAQ